MIGSVVGHYRVTARLSAGGMGIVYRAEHALLGKPVAIKVLHPELTTNRDVVDRFFKEAKATTSVRHVGIVEVYDFGYLESGHAYLVMEFLDGEPLSAAIRRGRFGQAAAIALLRGVCSALTAAHGKGIVHRDLKPDNIFLVPDPDSPIGTRPKLLDFGIAKLTDVGLAGTATRTGAVMGTPTYMSPEQCRGTGEVDHRADLYSLGCVLYELVAGRPPFISQGAGELIGAHLYVNPESPRVYAPELSVELERLIMSLLAKNPAERPGSAVELVQRLDEIARSGGALTGFPYDPARGQGGGMAPAHFTPMPSGMAAPSGTGPGFGVGQELGAPPPSGPPTPYRLASAPDALTMATPYSQSSPSLVRPAGPPPAMAPTTLSGTAGQVEAAARTRTRRRIAVAGLLGLVGAGIALGVVVAGSGGGAGSAHPTPGIVPAASPGPATSAPTPTAPGPVAEPSPHAEPAVAGAGVGAGAGAGAGIDAGPSGDAASSPTATAPAAPGEPSAATSTATKNKPKAKAKNRPRNSDVPTLIEDDI